MYTVYVVVANNVVIECYESVQSAINTADLWNEFDSNNRAYVKEVAVYKDVATKDTLRSIITNNI